MLALIALATLVADPVPDRVRKLLTSDAYTVTWKPPIETDPAATLEIGDGFGHGGRLGWLRFRPTKGGVEVLSVNCDEGREQYHSKWPPDRVNVTVKRARLSARAYDGLLGELAVVAAAETRRVESDTIRGAFADFWVYARLATADAKPAVALNWAGYYSSHDEFEYAKPQAAVTLARDEVAGLKFQPHVLTADERRWASEKFARDWAAFESLPFHWWVRERNLMSVGHVGDKTALPTLRKVMSGDPKGREVYHAINAATRLSGIDVRPKPVEDMDVVAVREKLLAALPPDK